MQRILGVIFTGMLAGGMSACAADPEAEIDTLFAAYQGDGTPGAALRVIRNGEPILTRTFGMADIDAGVAIGPDTNFRLASVTKQFTAMSILMLVEDGALRLDSTLPEIFDDFPAYGKDITVRYLLQHRSGLLDYETIMPEDATEQVHDSDVLRMMKEADHTYFEPGAEYRYSNSGYAVLAMMVEKYSGKSFATFLRENIFEPVGMRNTVAFENGVSTVGHRAFGYSVDGDAVEFTDQSPYSAVLGDGGIYSSLEDLFLWDQSLYKDELILPETKAAMLTPSLEDYGFGWRIDQYRGRLRYHHSGSTSGFRNFVARFPDDGLTVILLTNRAEPDVQPLAEKVADLFLQ